MRSKSKSKTAQYGTSTIRHVHVQLLSAIFLRFESVRTSVVLFARVLFVQVLEVGVFFAVRRCTYGSYSCALKVL